MTLIERIEQASTGIAVTAMTAAASGAVWLVRRIFTNQKQIEILQQSLEARDKQRDEDREALSDVRTDVREIREFLHRR
ncbi:hypothetical protein PhaeoP30_01845 [Phaeobacter inhibens]|uniref:Uncharacterized protein n=1 Tax=Phaeobacter piscinae TaxID=1580596 RepID=A0AAN1GR69_9RHOB|nr:MULTISPECIES: hypothetical protein [Phaeobacter]ATF17131.1 hypothetical protein PhaeoP129_00470 [Phaeobacter gallaeciensis]ATF21240.1 hypothetical protein PhaeoP128_00470 [Phaeobacter gallaeciensis]ATG35914.1 hypothetical protein PhaeoP36_01772 [Phaeobacter piscinae]ATG43678.1 hypothetical protein PhaeoP13_01741 [Phaeobacter piscinae]AUQ58760.1 hypothetical protein PhaeoP30_01845 [Phaeobacter inhibens]